MDNNMENILEEAKSMGLNIEPILVPYIRRSVSYSSKKRRDRIEIAFKQSRTFREHHEKYSEGIIKRFTTLSNICYVDARTTYKNFTTPEMDEIILAGLAEMYIFNNIFSGSINCD